MLIIYDLKNYLERSDENRSSTSVTVFDIYGRICHRSHLEKNETVTDVSDLKSGLYIINLSVNDTINKCALVFNQKITNNFF